MAGLFGLFNYEKEGPGIAKNAPKKHGFIVFFETFFRNFWKFITINLVYCLISLPIVTNGFANVGITHVARNTARDKHSFGLSDFFDTIKKNKKQAFIAGLINTVVYFLMFANTYFYWFYTKGFVQSIGLGFVIAVLFIFTIMNYYLWTLIITFNYTLKQAYMNSFRFVFVNLKYNLLCFVVNLLLLAAAIALVFLLPSYFLIVLTIEFFLYVAIYPCFNALLIQFCTFHSIKKYIIDPYYEEHPDEDIQKRHDLGIKTQAEILAEQAENEDDEEDSDVIFND
ncbi:MAG: DUF624 domain-containing protein [Ruminococcaceae bacterium]|nr:DUF624 domain-containing protein [Oscillospiraceae bacterium]